MINYSIYIASSKPGTKKADIAPRGFPFWGCQKSPAGDDSPRSQG